MKGLLMAVISTLLTVIVYGANDDNTFTTLIKTQYKTEYIYKINEKGDTVKVDNAIVDMYQKEVSCSPKEHLHYASKTTKNCEYFVNGWKVEIVRYKLKGAPEMKAPKAY